MVILYTFFTVVAILLFIALWIRTEKNIIIINTIIAVSLFFFTPTIVNTYYTASDDIRILFHSDHKNDIQVVEKTIQDQNLPFSLYKKESLQSSKHHNFLAILVVKTSYSKLTTEEIYSFIAKMPKNKMSISFSDKISGQVVIVETVENGSITNCFPEETCSILQI
ncbi:hypothetical protein [Paenibacillus sp. NPDC057934]|uniref:hypothetical protein n=1 Tax=Paenibacillus sp. NPDC057934 TaxID=3346282 RepID=UPI0036DA75BD